MKFLLIICTVSVFFSCNSTKKISIWSKKYCKLERLEYQEVTDTVRVTKNGKLEAGVKVNGKVIVDQNISLDTVKAYLESGNKVFINQSTMKVVKVSQAYYEQYNKNRASLCQIVEGVKSGIISSKEGKLRAEKEYLDMVRFFSGLSAEDEKKSPN